MGFGLVLGECALLFFDILMDLKEQGSHGLGPVLVFLLVGIGEFTEVMGIAEGMLTLEIEVRLPVIMDQDALEVRQSLFGFDGFHAPLGVGIKEGPLRVGNAVKPVIGAVDVDAGLIAMKDS